jgi:hypothetical protein
MSAPVPTPASASALPPGITDPNYSPLPGRLGNLTVPQQHALDTIRKELQDDEAFVPERMDDATLLRSVPTSHPSPSRNTLTPFHPLLLSPSHSSIPTPTFFLLSWWGVTLHRFLRARKFDVPKAKVMLLSAEEWRKECQLDELVQCVLPRRSRLVSVDRVIRAET